ncbi:acid protease [Cristinia sonorae]|uniref:Acid protease n=1 Tax=Cristinia sonorae TaxID=1940300 RepID=A0A8K0XS99_9AGAR|nr:acid protease [Cristinia sonorae]
MFVKTSLLVALSSAIVIAASPVVVVRDSPINIPLIKRFNARGDNRTLVERDRERIEALHRRASNVPTTNGLFAYTVTVNVGSPPTEYNLLLDTGSSNTWVGADPNRPHLETSTTTPTGQHVAFKYGTGEFAGVEVNDRLDLGNGLVIEQQGIGAATFSEDFEGFDGILAIGPVDLTIGSLSPDSTTPIPTVTDNLFAQGTISENLVAVSFEPPNSVSDTNGVVTFGGVDSTRFTGDIHFAPRTQVHNSTLWWGIDQTLTYGESTPIFAESTAGIVDTGTSLILLNPAGFNAYQAATGGVFDPNVGLLSFTPAQFAALESLFFHINGVTFELTPNAQIFPRQFNTLIGGSQDGIYGIIANLGIPRPVVPVFNSAFVNGMAFLERFYSVYDTANNQIGLATTEFTFAEFN